MSATMRDQERFDAFGEYFFPILRGVNETLMNEVGMQTKLIRECQLSSRRQRVLR